MTHLTVWLAPWLNPEVLRPLGLALLHFIWQGAALAVLARLVFALTRSANVRYVSGVFLLGLMVASPAVTFQVLRQRNVEPTPAADSAPAATLSAPAARAAIATPAAQAAPTASAVTPTPALIWLVEAWFLGVLLFSLRTVGGIVVLERLRRKSAISFSHTMLARCHELQMAMGLERVVRYCESVHIAAPAVVGWFRPIVMLPVTAVTGLSEAQLHAVIAHELAHIKRFDAFVNLFQIAAESLLFYHPAVWWLSKSIRVERENCCDDAAIAACGSPIEYARALTLMEEWRAVPELAMAVNRHPLAARIKRLLGAPTLESGLRTAGLSAAVLCLAAAIFAGNAFFGMARTQAAGQFPPAQPSDAENGAIVVRAERPESQKTAKPAPKPEPAAEKPVDAAPKQSYIESLRAEGIDNVSADDLIAMKVQGVTAEYIRGLHAAGLKPSIEELIGMKVQGVTPDYIKQLTDSGIKADLDSIIGMKVQGITPEYIQQMKSLGLNTDGDSLIGMKVQGVTPDYVKEMRDMGLKLDTDDLIGMKVQGITPAYIKQMRELGLKADSDSLMGMKVQGVTPEYVAAIRASGLNPDADNLIGMKVQGITPDYIKQMKDLGLKTDTDDLIGMKVQGVTPQYVQSIRSTGLNPDTDTLIGMKVQGVTGDYIKALQSSGFTVDADDVIGAKVQGVTPEFIEKAKAHGFKNLTLEKIIALKHAGVLE